MSAATELTHVEGNRQGHAVPGRGTGLYRPLEKRPTFLRHDRNRGVALRSPFAALPSLRDDAAGGG